MSRSNRSSADDLFVGNEKSGRQDYVTALGLPEDADWTDIAREQQYRYLQQKARDLNVPYDTLVAENYRKPS